VLAAIGSPAWTDAEGAASEGSRDAALGTALSLAFGVQAARTRDKRSRVPDRLRMRTL